jgi:hypothetical protein
MPDKGQKELGDLLKEGAAALVQMRKGIENACAELRTVYSKSAPRYSCRHEQGDAVTGKRGANNLSSGNKLLPLLPIDKPRLF